MNSEINKAGDNVIIEGEKMFYSIPCGNFSAFRDALKQYLSLIEDDDYIRKDVVGVVSSVRDIYQRECGLVSSEDFNTMEEALSLFSQFHELEM